MRIVNAELLIPTGEEILERVQRAYEAGRARGREEARREFQNLLGLADEAACEANGAAIFQPERFRS